MANPNRIPRTHANADDLLRRSRRNANGCIEWQGSTCTSGYGQFWLQGKHQLTHRLMAKLVIPNPNNLPVVMHTCDNRLCLNPEHLLWGTVKDNNADRHKKGRSVMPNNAGSKHGMAKLSEAQILVIRKDLITKSQAQVAREQNVSRSCIGLIAANKRWAHIQLSDI